MKAYSTWRIRVPAVSIILTLWIISQLNAQTAGGIPPSSAGVKNTPYASEWQQAQSDPARAAFQSWAVVMKPRPAPEAKAGLVSEGVALAKQRRALLAGLIKNNPEKALALAVPMSIRNQLPREIASGLESRVAGIGDFSVLGVLAASNGPAVEPIRRFVHLNGQPIAPPSMAGVWARRPKPAFPSTASCSTGDGGARDALRELETDESPGPAGPVTDLRNAAARAANLPSVLGEMGTGFIALSPSNSSDRPKPGWKRPRRESVPDRCNRRPKS